MRNVTHLCSSTVAEILPLNSHSSFSAAVFSRVAHTDYCYASLTSCEGDVYRSRQLVTFEFLPVFFRRESSEVKVTWAVKIDPWTISDVTQ